MDFEFSDSQKQLKEEARRFLASKSSIRAVRAVLDGRDSYDRALWAELATMGFLGTAIPECYGGVGAGYLELCAIAEEMGRALAPVPFCSSIYLAAPMLLDLGTQAQKQAYLPKIAAGELIGCAAFLEGIGQPRAEAVVATAKAERLTGTKLAVLDGDIADIAIVLANEGDAENRMLSLFIVDLRKPGVSRSSLQTIDPTRSQARIDFADAPVERLGSPGEGWRYLMNAFDRAAILLAFEQVGGAERALEMARDYANERVAFGRPIGSFQALKHKLTDMYIATVLARSNAYFGAWTLSVDSPEICVAAAASRLCASHAFQYCTTENCHVFGAMGFTWEADCHLFFRRARLLSLVIGGEQMWGDRLIERMHVMHETVGHTR